MKTTIAPLHKNLTVFPGIVLFVIVLFAGYITVNGQETNDSVVDVTPSLTLNYLCLSDDSVILTADIFVRKEYDFFALKNAVIDFTARNGDKTIQLGSIPANDRGKAILKAPVPIEFLDDKEGTITYEANFIGKGHYLPVSADFTARPAILTVTFSTEDSVRYIHVSGFQVEPGGIKKPIAGEDVQLYVPRLFSLMNIGNLSLDEEGNGQTEYPGRLIGDSTGNITIIARIEEHDLFGNAQGYGIIDWATPKHLVSAETFTRELWTPIAPIWMIITLIIMLTGVWGHYIYAVIQLIKIKRLSKENKTYS